MFCAIFLSFRRRNVSAAVRPLDFDLEVSPSDTDKENVPPRQLKKRKSSEDSPQPTIFSV
jgi:hypothetical protein